MKSTAHFMTIAEYNRRASRENYVPWTESEVAAIKAMGVITPAARWDCASMEQRMEMNPALNPNKRWFEQKAWKLV
jgi:hypothetical protein